VGTLVALLFTFGFWILTLPFYKSRCVVCGMSREENSRKQIRGERAASGLTPDLVEAYPNVQAGFNGLCCVAGNLAGKLIRGVRGM